jgi:hypothetical protein
MMIDLTTTDYGDVYQLLRRDPRQSLQSDRPLKLKHCTSVDQAIAMLGGDIAGFVTLLSERTGKEFHYKQIAHWRSKNKFPANMTWLMETMLNEQGYAPVFEILTQIPVDVSEEMALIEQLAAQRTA